MPNVAIELVRAEEARGLKLAWPQVRSEDLTICSSELGAVPVVIDGFAEIRFRQLHLAEGAYAVSGDPRHIYIGLFRRRWHSLRLPSCDDSFLTKGSEQRRCGFGFAR